MGVKKDGESVFSELASSLPRLSRTRLACLPKCNYTPFLCLLPTYIFLIRKAFQIQADRMLGVAQALVDHMAKVRGNKFITSEK
ncbi:hypothetical protein V6N13_075280 [Hibiscus sabdariffa]